MSHRTVVLGMLLISALLGGVEVAVAAEPSMAPTGSSVLQDKVTATVARDLQSTLTAAPQAGDLRLLNPSLSLPPGAVLHVISVRAGYSPDSWLLRLACSSRRDCLPFHVLLHAPGADLHQSLVKDFAGQRPGEVESSRPQMKSKQLRPPVIRSGDRVLLVEERSGMRLKAMVVCLQAGGLGDEIHVRNLATRRVLLATVAGQNLVRVQ